MSNAAGSGAGTSTRTSGSTSFNADAMAPRRSDPLSIVHVLAPGAIGGLESVVRVLSRAQRRVGHDVRVMCVLETSRPHPYVALLEREGVDVRPVVVSGRGYTRERAYLAALCAERLPDVVHTHGYRPDLVDAPVARRLGVATVSTIHGFTGGGLKMRAYEWMVERAYRRFDAVIAVSRPLKARLVARGVSSSRVHVLRNAFVAPSSSFVDRATARRELSIADGTFAVGWAGRLSNEKGVDVLVRALGFLEPGSSVRASIIGAGTCEVDMRALSAAIGVSDRIRWHGTIPDSYRLYRAFDAFVLSSRTEGTPMVLLEAMTAEVPIVTTSVGGVPDMVSPNEALLVPSEQPAALAGAIEAVRREPVLARSRAVAARRRLDEEFAIGPWLERHEAIYRAVKRQPAENTPA